MIRRIALLAALMCSTHAFGAETVVNFEELVADYTTTFRTLDSGGIRWTASMPLRIDIGSDWDQGNVLRSADFGSGGYGTVDTLEATLIGGGTFDFLGVWIDGIYRGYTPGVHAYLNGVLVSSTPYDRYGQYLTALPLIGVDKVVFEWQGTGLSLDGFTYSVTAVPEPGSWAMLGAGLLMVGALTRRRQV